MDGFNRSSRLRRPLNTPQNPRHITIKGDDESLTELYRNSEYGGRAAVAASSANAKKAEEDQAITNFVDANKLDTEAVPLKKSAAKAAKLQAKKAKQKSRRGRFLKRLILALVLLGLLAAALFFVFRTSSSSTKSNLELATSAPDEIYYSTLTGNEVKDPKLASGATTCVMIENSPAARPQSGLDAAGVVYEVIAEGGITRFMAVFQENKPDYIGPVRSVRLTFAELAKPYQCGIAHVGGSDNALNLIRNSANGYRDLDQFFNANYYWRIRSRTAPHNVYTSFEKLDQLSFNKGFTSSNFSGFARVNPDTKTVPEDRNATTVRINMSAPLYNPVYSYDATTNSYRRAFASGGAHTVQAQNGTRKELAPKVVIAMKANAIARAGDSGNRDYVTTGAGDAFVFQNGTVITGQWRRADANSELHFVDQNGNDIPLERGQTWISVYPAGTGSVTWSK